MPRTRSSSSTKQNETAQPTRLTRSSAASSSISSSSSPQPPPPPVTTSRRRNRKVPDEEVASVVEPEQGQGRRKKKKKPEEEQVIHEEDDDEEVVKETQSRAVVRLPRLGAEEISRRTRRVVEQEEDQEKSEQEQVEPPQQQQQPHQVNPHLPPPSSLPSPSAPHAAQTESLQSLRINCIRPILSEIMNQVQDSTDDPLSSCYRRVERLYNYISEVYKDDQDEENRKSASRLASRYKNMVVLTLWGFGAVIWKVPTTNPYVQKTCEFILDCLMRLGWKRGEQRSRRNHKRSVVMGEWEDEGHHPACYYAVNLFVRHHSDPNTSIRQHELSIMLKLVQTASASRNGKFLRHVFNNASKALLIRLKDRSSSCRALAMATLSELLQVPGADDVLKKELKYYTRYDPSVEVRRIGTSAARSVERLKLRFFFDQAFDRNMSVRFEAFKAMGVVAEGGDEMSVEEGEGDGGTVRLIREMDQLTGDKLCKLVLWGALYSDSKCSSFVKTELLRKWLTISCKNDLVRFLTNLDPFQHLVAVNKIMDMMFNAGGEVERGFVESIDLSFITKLKADIMGKRFKELSIEAVVGWLGLCKASRRVESLRGRVVPSGEEMGELVQCLHECVFLENRDAGDGGGEGREEEAGPLFCVVVGLEVCRFVEWEEGGRRHMRRVIKNMLLDSLMEERIFVVQAINILESMFTDAAEFEELMMDVFQDVFDARSDCNRERRERSSLGAGEGSSGSAAPAVACVEEEEDPVVPMTPYQLTKLRDQICELASARLKLNLQKDELIRQKLFMEAVPLNSEIMRLQDEEAKLKAGLREQEEIAKAKENKKKNQEQGGVLEGVSDQLDAIMDDDDGEDGENVSVAVTTRDDGGVIGSVEEGLTKGMFMINAYMDLNMRVNAFLRNLYENYASQYLMVEDITTRVCVLQFMARVAMIEKRELMPAAHLFVTCLVGGAEVEIVHMAFKCVVDLLVFYDWGDFVGGGGEGGGSVLPFVRDFTTYLQKYLDDPSLTYETCRPEHMKALFLELLTKRFPPPASKSCGPEMSSILFTTKYQGLLKLLVRGRLREPGVVAGILALWVNNDYCGTPVLRDLESVVKLYGTFEWWWGGGGGNSVVVDEEDGEEVVVEGKRDEAMRVLGVSVGEAVVLLCREGGRGDDCGSYGDNVVKFVGYFLGFLDAGDQPLMRTIATTILSPVEQHPTRSYNTTLVRSASKIPITSIKSAKIIMRLVDAIGVSLRGHPGTPSVVGTRKELGGFVKRLVRVFGEGVVYSEGRDGDDEGGGEGEEECFRDNVVGFSDDDEEDGGTGGCCGDD